MKTIDEFNAVPPSNWNNLISYAGQAIEYAEAMRDLGYKPHYYHDSNQTALIQIRGLDYPLINKFTRRAYIYPYTASKQYIEEIIERLKSIRVPLVRIGNNNWGVKNKEILDIEGSKIIDRYTFVIDLSQNEEDIWKNFNKKTRGAVRKAEKEGVTVREISDQNTLPLFYTPYYEVAIRVRAIQPYTIFPLSVFQSFLSHSRTSRYARFFVAEYNGKIIAGDMVICFGDTMLAYQGGMLREFSSKQGPTALIWHCIKLAKEEGFKIYDLGGCTPGLDESNPRYAVYAFKKRFSGELIKFYNAEITLNKKIRQFQDKYLLKIFNRVHPYLKK